MDVRSSIRDDFRQSTVNVNSWNQTWTNDLTKSLPSFHDEIVNIGDGFRGFNIPGWGEMVVKRVSPNDGRGTARDSANERVVIQSGARQSILPSRTSVVPNRNEIIKPDGTRESLLPERQSILPNRTSVSSNRQSIIPERSVIAEKIEGSERQSILPNRTSVTSGRQSVASGRQSCSTSTASARMSVRDIVLSEVGEFAARASIPLSSLMVSNSKDKNVVYPKRTPVKEIFKNDRELIRFPLFRGILYYHPDTNAVDHIEEGGEEILRGRLFASLNEETKSVEFLFDTCQFPYEEFIKKDIILEDEEFERDNDLSYAEKLPGEVNRQSFLDNYFPEKIVTRGGIDYAHALRYPSTSPDGLHYFANKSIYNGSEYEIHFTVIKPGTSVEGLFVNKNHGANELEIIWDMIEEIPNKIESIYKKNSTDDLVNDSLWRRKFTCAMLTSVFSMMKEIKLTCEFRINWGKKLVEFSTRRKKAEYVDNGIIDVFEFF